MFYVHTLTFIQCRDHGFGPKLPMDTVLDTMVLKCSMDFESTGPFGSLMGKFETWARN